MLSVTSSWSLSTKKILTSIAVLAVFFAFFCVPMVVFAQDATLGLGGELGESVNLGKVDLRVMIARGIQIVFGVLGTVLLIIILYAGWLWMTSQGDEEKITSAKNILKNAVIGLAIMLMAFSITTFIIRLLTDATGMTGNTNMSGRGPAVWNDFSGSGALGKIISDHYPARDQRDVPRNTKIMVSFREPIDPTSVIVNVNNGTDTKLGECKQQGATFNWQTDCDKIDTSAVLIYRSNDPLKQPVEGAAMASYEGDDVKTFSFRPYEYLGSDSEDVEYTVVLTKEVEKKSGGSAFVRLSGGQYIWKFETGTTLDFTPPHVVDTYPQQGEKTARNYLIQVTFDEPMDPTTVQGTWSTNSNFFNIVTQPTSSVFAEGTWSITNGFKTIEFTPKESCGFNACGDIMYCLPVNRPDGCAQGQCPVTAYQMLLRTAETLTTSTFEAIPFTGIVDASGNALDSGKKDLREGKPTIVSERTIGAGEVAPDNYYWQFGVEDTIDTTAPYIHSMTPSIDAERVAGDAELSLLFGTRMSLTSLVNLGLEEDDGKGSAQDIRFVDEAGDTKILDPIWFSARSLATTTSIGGQTVATTYTSFHHRMFGPNNMDLYYYTSIPSSVKSLNQNCMYPGRGPAPESEQCVYSEINGVVTATGCVDVSKTDANADAGCGIGEIGADRSVSSTDACIQQLRTFAQSLDQ